MAFKVDEKDSQYSMSVSDNAENFQVDPQLIKTLWATRYLCYISVKILKSFSISVNICLCGS